MRSAQSTPLWSSIPWVSNCARVRGRTVTTLYKPYAVHNSDCTCVTSRSPSPPPSPPLPSPSPLSVPPGDEGKALRAELAKLTDRTSVPNIWIDGKSVGGCNDGPGVLTLQREGKLVPMLRAAGAL